MQAVVAFAADTLQLLGASAVTSVDPGEYGIALHADVWNMLLELHSEALPASLAWTVCHINQQRLLCDEC